MESTFAIKIVEEAKKELEEICAPLGINLNTYLKPDKLEKMTIEEVMRKLLFHAQNGTGKLGIKFIANEKVIKEILENYNPEKILNNYNSSHKIFERLFNDILANNYCNEALKNKYKCTPKTCNVENCKRKDWRLYSATAFYGAKLFKGFKNGQEVKNLFDELISKTDKIVPVYLLKWIPGLGNILPYDFLKEIGYQCYAKPDVHIKDILSALKLTPNTEEETIINCIDEVSVYTGHTPYYIDKLLWLTCTHDFYLDKDKIQAFYDQDKNQKNETYKSNSKYNNKRKNEFIEKMTNN